MTYIIFRDNMKFKILAFLITSLFILGSFPSALSLDFEARSIHTNEFDILYLIVDDINYDGDYEIIFYTAGKSALCIDLSGNVKWSIDSNNSYSFLKLVEAFDSNGKEVVLGTENIVFSRDEIYSAFLYFIDSNGNEIHTVPILGSILDVDIGDLTLDGRNEITVGADDGQVYLFDEDFDLLWNYRTRGYNFRTVITDLNQDGTKEVVAISWDNTIILDSEGKLINDYLTNHILRDLHMDRFNNMIHVSRRFREESKTWAGTVVYSLNRNLNHMWEFRTGIETSASGFFDLNNDGQKEIVIAGTNGEIIILDSRGNFVKRLDLPDRIFKIDILNHKNKNYLVASSRDNSLYILDYETGDIEYKFETGGWIETFHIVDINNDSKKDIVLGSNDNQIYVLMQKYEETKVLEDENVSVTDKESFEKESKSVPFEGIGVIVGILIGGAYLVLKKIR